LKSKDLVICFIVLLVWAAMPAFAAEEASTGIPPVPTPGRVTMVDLGTDKCVPCKMMAPILEELRKEYDGRASIIFIDVWKRREQAQRFGIRAIPTQIFYDKEGKEVGRHVGFMDKKNIVEMFKKLGVPELSDR